MNKLLDIIINWLAEVLPDNCPLATTILGITITPCKLNPLYEQVIRRKIQLLGYDLDILEDGTNPHSNEANN